MTNRPATLLAMLFGLHRVEQLDDLLPYLLRGPARENGQAIAACFLIDRASGEYRLELLADTSATLNLENWERELKIPAVLPHGPTATLLGRLAAKDLDAGAGPLPELLDGVWPSDVSLRLQQKLGSDFGVAAPIWSEHAPVGVLLFLAQSGWSQPVAIECVAHTATALGRLLAQGKPDEAFDQIVAREMDRAKRYGRVVSVAVIELPEEHRSPARQFAATALAARLLRQSDSAGYLGAGRIVAILPETSGSGAAGFLGRAQREPGLDLPDLRSGHATFPDDGDCYEALMAAAIDRLAVSSPTAKPTTWLGDPDLDNEQPGAAKDNSGAALGAAATLRIRIVPFSDTEVARWQSLLGRLPAVVEVRPSDYDGFAGTFEVRTSSVTRVLSGLQRVASKIEATLSMTVAGEVRLALRSTPMSPRSRPWLTSPSQTHDTPTPRTDDRAPAEHGVAIHAAARPNPAAAVAAATPLPAVTRARGDMHDDFERLRRPRRGATGRRARLTAWTKLRTVRALLVLLGVVLVTVPATSAVRSQGRRGEPPVEAPRAASLAMPDTAMAAAPPPATVPPPPAAAAPSPAPATLAPSPESTAAPDAEPEQTATTAGPVEVAAASPVPTAPPRPVATATPRPAIPATYVVQPGDTIWLVAQRFGLDHMALVQLNRIPPDGSIYPSQVLRLR